MEVVSVGEVLVAVVFSGIVAVSAGLVCVEEIDVSAAVVLLKPLVVDEVTVDSADSDVVAASVAVLVAVVAVAASLDGVMPVGLEVEEGPSVALVVRASVVLLADVELAVVPVVSVVAEVVASEVVAVAVTVVCS